MSPLGKFLLTHCNDDLTINLQEMRDQFTRLGAYYWQARMLAVKMGLTLIGE